MVLWKMHSMQKRGVNNSAALGISRIFDDNFTGRPITFATLVNRRLRTEKLTLNQRIPK